MNSYALFGRQARYQPERPALVEGGRTLSYAALDRLAGQYATALQRAGIEVGDRVGVLLKERAARHHPGRGSAAHRRRKSAETRFGGPINALVTRAYGARFEG